MRESVYLSPTLNRYNEIKDIIKELNYRTIDDKELIAYERTLAIIKPFQDKSIVEASALINKYKVPVVFLTNDSKFISTFKNNSYIHMLLITDNYQEFKNRLYILLKLIEYTFSDRNGKVWLDGILNSTTEGIIGINRSCTIEFMNPIAQNIVGIVENNAKGKTVNEVVKLKTVSIDDIPKNTNFEDEIYNKITREFNHISGEVTSVVNEYGEKSGYIIVIRSIGEMKRLFNKVKYQATHDELTGLYNRQSFINSIDEHISLSKIDSSSHGLIIISIDKFKIINDTSGHLAGDELLRKVSYLIRQIDTENQFIKARIGGDEFGLILPSTNIQEIKRITKIIQREISTTNFIWGDKEFPVNCSFGITEIDNSSKNHYDLLAALDNSCAVAKEKGGNSIEIYDRVDDKYNRRKDEMLWIHKLKGAIDKDLFTLYYQEIVPVKMEEFKKIEVLLRLKDPDGTVISPSDFIAPAERYGLMPAIDRIVIEKSIEYCKNIIDNKEIKTGYIFSVNLSGASIADKTLPKFIQSIFKKFRVPPTLFCFEITETSTISNLDIAKKFISTLKRIGCTFSLDDFGSGFSNFSYLKSLDVDYLKIDGSLVHNINEKPVNKAIVESINNIGHAMKLKTVAEFVKNEKVKQEVKNIGVDYMQGYVLSTPTPLDDLLNSN